MRLYSGSSDLFIKDATQKIISEKLKFSFFEYFRFNPPQSEIQSWQNSLESLSSVMVDGNLGDTGIILEYQLPLSSKRLDCLICGRDQNNQDNAVVVELKQWSECKESNCENEVITWLGGTEREVLHPCVQVEQYKRYLMDVHTVFYEDKPVHLDACSYLHNYPFVSTDVIFANKFQNVISRCPLFTGDDTPRLTSFLQSKFDRGRGLDVLQRIEESKYRPSKKLMDHVGNIIKGSSEYILLDEQLIVYDFIFSLAKNCVDFPKKSVIIVKGGPGTGKSVIAINVMADLLLLGFNSHYATGSRAFTETLRNKIGSRGSIQFKYFNSYTKTEFNAIDILIADEAHRIRSNSSSRYTPAKDRSDITQIEELIHSAKVSVFFIDDDQVVRPNEIGSVEYIKKHALQKGCQCYEYELEAQFRCNGSDAFINWINNTLGIKRTANIIWDLHEEFDFQIFDDPFSLEQAIRQKDQEGYTARLTAGFCWEWSKDLRPDRTLYDDVLIGDFSRPWNARPEATRLATGIPKASIWANDPNGINQVGCVYTAQGFEFDYVGVIFGMDLVYDFKTQSWKANKSESYDPVVKRSGDKFIELVKNTYRVLLSRGMKGCYVYFTDKDTENFFRSRIEYH